MKALETYISKFSEYEKERGENAYSGEWKFLVEHFEDINDYFDKVDRDDVIGELQGKTTEETTVEDFSPLKLEGMHSLHLEKAMQIRYSSYDPAGNSNVLSCYVAAAVESSIQGNMIESAFSDGITKWSNE
jgi:hypothetical protein